MYLSHAGSFETKPDVQDLTQSRRDTLGPEYPPAPQLGLRVEYAFWPNAHHNEGNPTR
jgi:hypothetical protein